MTNLIEDNCFGMCLGKLLGIDPPDMWSDTDGHAGQLQRLARILDPMGLSYVEVEWNYELSRPANWPDTCPYMLRVAVMGDNNHMVLCRGSRIVYDPMEPAAGDVPIYVPLSVIFVVKAKEAE